MILSVWDLREAALSWEKCADASEPVHLGGPPPFPGARCLLRMRITRPDYDALSDEEADRDVVPPQLDQVIYVYRLGWVETGKVKQHFLSWAKGAGSEADFHGYRSYSLDVEAGGRSWTIRALQRRGPARGIEVQYTERRGRPKPRE